MTKTIAGYEMGTQYPVYLIRIDDENGNIIKCFVECSLSNWSYSLDRITEQEYADLINDKVPEVDKQDIYKSFFDYDENSSFAVC
ncbi:hypothetical protein [Vibrio parahaemolyticus]|uniref:hypothetical protein n=1 Tax=Vibrio TaxID=662 RepID=UPI00265B24B8|nr:hypothetical protein [Vibrio parahaemolyticus]ELB2204933.1 hypothetical protein [Vibrio parahaemolyticus]MCS0027736.1 hypothetical protein [Vibrio alginolyticus]